MIPKAWFYKLRHTAAVHSDQKKHQVSHSSSSSAITDLSSSSPNRFLPRKSYHFARQVDDGNGYYDFPINGEFSDSFLPEPPRTSSKLRRRRRVLARSPPKHVHSSISARCGKSESPPGFSSSPVDSPADGDFRTDAVLATESFDGVVSWATSKSKSCAGKTNLMDDDDIIIDIDKDSFVIKGHKDNDFNSSPEIKLAPIMTKPATFSDMIIAIKKEKIVEQEKRKYSGNSLGLKLLVNSWRIGSRIFDGGSGRKSVSSSSSSSSSSTAASSWTNKSLSGSFAVVKSSSDPQRDFRESMVEMIVENDINTTEDMVDLLACYLSLNADEYHDLIIKVFKQIWSDLPNSQIKK